MKRSQTSLIMAGVLAAAGVTLSPAAPASASTTCTVDASNTWADGYVLAVGVNNTGPGTVSGWTVRLNFAEPPGITGSWSAALSTAGNVVTATNVSYNGDIAAGQTASFGLQGTHDGTFSPPTCTVAGGTTEPPATTPPATTTPPVTTTTAPATTTPPAPADITVNPATKYQTVDGFGAATPIWGGAWSTTDTQTLVGLGTNQLGLSIVRTGLSPVSGEWSTAVNSLKTAKSYGSGVKILASPWTAPANFKTNNSRTGGGKLKTDYYDDYAAHLNSYVQYMKGQGVTIDVTSVQNEPDWHPDYDSMDWNGTELRNFVHDQGAKITDTKLLVAESLGFNRSYTDPTLNDATARANLGYIGGHLYGTEASGNLSTYPLAAQYGKNQWMTEWNLHAADGSGSNIWGDPGNVKVWNETLDDVMRTVHRSMEANWSAYVWWYGKRYYSFIGDGEAQFGTTAGAPLKRGFAFSQFAKYVRPGYQRVGLTKSTKASPLEVTAYQGNGKIVLVVLNRSSGPISKAVIQVPQSISAAQYVATSQSQNAAGQAATVNGSQVTVDVGARSISTVVLTTGS